MAAANNTQSQILPVSQQSTPAVTVPGGGGSLPGSTYTGALGSSVNSIPFLGGAAEGLLSSLYGSKYGIPNPGQTAGAAISGNLGNLAGIYGLSTGADTASGAGVQSEYLANLPDYTGLLTTATGNVGQELQGDVPADVQRNLQTAAAERGVTTGQGANSQNDNASYLQALGLTSIGQMQTGMQGFNQLYQDTPTGPAFNPSSMLVTPEQQQAAQLAANQEAAAPDPQAAGLLNTFSSFF
jgi:hypothetical protein